MTDYVYSDNSISTSVKLVKTNIYLEFSHGLKDTNDQMWRQWKRKNFKRIHNSKLWTDVTWGQKAWKVYNKRPNSLRTTPTPTQNLWETEATSSVTFCPLSKFGFITQRLPEKRRCPSVLIRRLRSDKIGVTSDGFLVELKMKCTKESGDVPIKRTYLPSLSQSYTSTLTVLEGGEKREARWEQKGEINRERREWRWGRDQIVRSIKES